MNLETFKELLLKQQSSGLTVKAFCEQEHLSMSILIDNNLAENAIRPITLGRKNYLFCGNHEAAKHMAIICSLIGTCKEQDVNPRLWLNDIIAKMPYMKKASQEELLQLLPHHWKHQHPETLPPTKEN